MMFQQVRGQSLNIASREKLAFSNFDVAIAASLANSKADFNLKSSGM